MNKAFVPMVPLPWRTQIIRVMNSGDHKIGTTVQFAVSQVHFSNLAAVGPGAVEGCSQGNEFA